MGFKDDIFPKGDWKNNESKFLIQKWAFADDIELERYVAKMREAEKFINTGNKGGKFDYDLCISDKCWGGNSNTVQKLAYEKMGLSVEWPEDKHFPGVKGKFYEGALDDFWRKYGEELQKEQP